MTGADTPGPRAVERPWDIPCQCDHRYAEHIAGSGCRLCECRQYAERAGSPATAAGRRLRGFTTFHSGACEAVKEWGSSETCTCGLDAAILAIEAEAMTRTAAAFEERLPALLDATEYEARASAESLDVERLARAMEATGHCGQEHRPGPSIVPSEHDHEGCLFRPQSLADAALIADEYARLAALEPS